MDIFSTQNMFQTFLANRRRTLKRIEEQLGFAAIEGDQAEVAHLEAHRQDTLQEIAELEKQQSDHLKEVL